MSLTIRMKRALAAFRAPIDPTGKAHNAFSEVVSFPPIDKDVAEVMESSSWKVHSDYHRSRIVMGHRLDWYTTKTGRRESAGYNGKMYYGEAVRALFRSLGIKDRWT